MEIKITKENFEAEVLKADRPVLVDFWATWCGPCMMLGPVLAEIAEERKDVIRVGKVNVDEEPELAAKYGIMSIPAVLLFKNGEVVANSVGYVPKEDLNEFVSANI
ncbi:MAG: thioredoxin [bacterium]|nr:thioredoxin [Candidatus Colisoma equi]